MFIQQCIWSALFLLLAGVTSSANAQTPTSTQTPTIQPKESKTLPYGVVAKKKQQDENQAAYTQNEDFDLDKYIDSIDWEAERESILKWYSTVTEDKTNTEEK